MEKPEKLAGGTAGGDAPGKAGWPVLSKQEAAKRKRDFELHVALIMRQDDCSKSVALFRAWLEGEKGLFYRLPD